MTQDIFVVVEHLRGQVMEISYVMLAAARKLAGITGGQVVAVLLGHNAQPLAQGLGADRVLYGDDAALADSAPTAYQQVLQTLIAERQPRAVLMGNTSVGADVASGVAAKLDLPVIGSCLTISEDGTLVSRICGGKIMAETELPQGTAFVTMIPGGFAPEGGQSSQPAPVETLSLPPMAEQRITLKQYIEPEAGDVDISKESILVAVGRGIQNQDNMELAEALAQALGGVVCASRPVVDQGWLPTSRLVGKSGKAVKPKLYLAMGISGAPEHMEALSTVDVLIAINMDPGAPIFQSAKYGVEADLFEVVPALTEKIQQAKAS